MMTDPLPGPNQWSESTSATFLNQSELFVPARSEQLETLLGLIPSAPDESCTFVELAAGGGLLAERILESFPRCHYLALDGSPLMREHLAERLARFHSRLEIRDFELSDHYWRIRLPAHVRCFLSSLCVHHLSSSGKRQLFLDLSSHLEPGGAILLADIVRPASPSIAALYAQQYDEIVKAQSLATFGDLSGYAQFQSVEWNYFRYDYPNADTYDQPSLLSEQLAWLSEAGLNPVDCFWLRAGHAVFGGYKNQ